MRNRATLKGSLVLLLCLALLAGCAGKANLPGAPADVNGLADIPAPSALAGPVRPRSASFVDSDCQKDGSTYAAGGNNLVAVNGTACNFSPAFNKSQGLSTAAYCLFAFDIAGYDRDPDIRHSWSVVPNLGKFWLGLADWNADEWKWFQGDPAKDLAVGAMAPYIRADGRLLLCVMCLGTKACTLDSVRVGSEPPVISLSATPGAAFAPFSVALDASASTDPDGSIKKYEWDLDGDGSFELDAGLDATQQIQVTSAGLVKASVRVTDNKGVKSTKLATIHSLAEWVHSWGGGGQDQLFSSAYDGLDGLYFCGATTSFGAGSNDMLLLKYNLAGDLIWARTWGNAQANAAQAMAIDPDGNIIVAGNSFDGTTDSGVVSFSPDGAVLWSRNFWPSANGLQIKSMCIDGPTIYIAGIYDPIGQIDPDTAVLLSLANNGIGGWVDHFSLPGLDADINSIKVHTTFPFGSPELYACGTAGGQVLYLTTDTNGTITGQKVLALGNGQQRGLDISVSGLGLTSVWICGQDQSNLGSGALLAEYSSSSPVCRIWDAGGGDMPDSLVHTSDGRFLLTGYSASFQEVAEGLFLGYSSGGALEASSRLHRTSSNVNLWGHSELLSDMAVMTCGYAAGASGASWLTATGASNTESGSWNATSLTVDHPALVVNASSGTLGTPGTAVLDSGGGDGMDAVAVVHAVP